MNLNPEQQQAVKHISGPCIVTAVPGSGKTAVLTARTVFLIKYRDVDPKNILCTTFTNKAANEMRERVAKQVGVGAEKVFIQTFHGLCLAILREYGQRVGLHKPFTVYSEKDQLDLLAKISRMEEYEASKGALNRMAKAVNDMRENIDEDEVEYKRGAPVEVEIMEKYLQFLDEFNAVDFSGILYKCWQLLDDKEVSERMSNRFHYLMIDESQDMNMIQYDICKKIGAHRNLFWVGDYHQSIFSWRGARPDILFKIKEEFPDVNTITLPRNYRSTRQILQAAENLINNNDHTEKVELISEVGDGADVMIDAVFNDELEAESIVNRAKQLKGAGFKWSDCAVLYRTNALSKSPEIALRNAGIPYKIIGGFSFFDRKEIKTVLAYLNFMSNPKDTISFARAITEPKRGVGDAAIGKLEKICHEEKVCIFEACQRIDDIPGIASKAKENIKAFTQMVSKYREQEDKGISIGDVAAGMLEESGYIKYMKNLSESDPTENKRIDNIYELLKEVYEFGTKTEGSRISDYLNSISIMTSDARSDDEDAVSLLTMHTAKGLEFPAVFVIGMDNKTVPHPLAVNERGEDEERRLTYVALTRAQKFLFVTYPRTRRRMGRHGPYFQDCGPSPFIFEIDPSFVAPR